MSIQIGECTKLSVITERAHLNIEFKKTSFYQDIHPLGSDIVRPLNILHTNFLQREKILIVNRENYFFSTLGLDALLCKKLKLLIRKNM